VGLSNIIIGLILLVFGRKLFWLFVAMTGFLVGAATARVFFADEPEWVILSTALGVGLLGAVLAVVAKRVAFALAGFYAGSYLAMTAFQMLGGGGNGMIWLVFGGVIGGVFAALIMDWAIIVLSCLVGAGAIVQTLPLRPTGELVVFVVLMVSGFFLQRRLMIFSQTGSSHPPT